MPELPEVETVCRDLQASVVGQTIVKVAPCDPMVLVDLTPRQFARRLTGRKVLDVRRWGKVLIIELSGNVCLLVHLRMSGRLYPVPEGESLPDHTRAAFALSDGRKLLFVNPRRLGRLETADCECLGQAKLLRKMGIDALSDELDEQKLRAMLRPHSIALKQWLLDQTHIAGIGNIYASEILHRARLHPDTPANSLPPGTIHRLLSTMQRVLREAIKWRGTTVSDYVTGRGVPGEFQKKLRVYGRAGRRCRRRGCPGIIVRTTHAGRSTYFCPHCQPPPKD